MERSRTAKPIPDEGSLTDRLIPTEKLSQLMSEFLAAAQRYTFIVERWPVDLRTSEPQEDRVFLEEIDLNDGRIDPVLVRASVVHVVVEMPDKGLGRIDLTARRWQIWRPSDQLDAAVVKLRDGLREAGRWPLLVPKVLVFLGVWPIVLLIAAMFVSMTLVVIVELVNPGAVPGPTDAVAPTELDPAVEQVVTRIVTGVAIAWVASIVLALSLTLCLRLIGGGVGHLPSNVSAQGLLRVLVRIRLSSSLKQVSNAVLIAVTSAVVTAVVLWLLFGKDPVS